MEICASGPKRAGGETLPPTYTATDNNIPASDYAVHTTFVELGLADTIPPHPHTNVLPESDRPSALTTAETDALSKPPLEAVEQITTLPFPKIGVKKAAFRAFIEACGGTKALEGLTTSEVNVMFLMPATEAHQTSYCDVLVSQGSLHVGEGQVFISHAWKFLFLDVVEALEYHFDEDIVIWFDLFSNNQHRACELPFDWWTETFKSSIEQFAHVVLVLSPWTDPIPLKRAWCLYEIYCATTTSSRFEIAMSASDRQDFQRAISNNDLEPINKMIAAIDVTQSEAFKPTDKEAIFACIAKCVGFDCINKKVLGTLREWVISIMKTALRLALLDPQEDGVNIPTAEFTTTAVANRLTDSPSNHRAIMIANIKSSLGQLHYSHGNFSDALPLLQESCASRIQMLGLDDIKTLQSQCCLADLFHRQGFYSKADEMYYECITNLKRVLGENHEQTLSTMGKLAMSLYDQTHMQESAKIYLDVMVKRQQFLGVNHPDTLSTMHGYALLLWKTGRYTEAEEINTACLQRRAEVLGANHPDTLETGRILGLIFWRQNRLEEARKSSEEAWRLMKVRLGDNSPETLHAHNQVAMVLQSAGRCADAMVIFRECYNIRIEAFGEAHPDTLHSLHGLASAILANGDADTAEKLFVNALALRQTALGENHLDTQHSNFGLACCRFKRRFVDEALERHMMCLAARKQRLGVDDHPDIFRSMFEIAMCLKALPGRRDEALSMLHDCYLRRQRTFGDSHPETMLTQVQFATLQNELA